MPRPQSKNELIKLSQYNFSLLNEFIDSLPEQKQEFPKTMLNRNIRDVLAHLHHWHLMMIEWYNTGMKGENPEMPAKGYTWRTTPEFNKFIQKQYSTMELPSVKKLLKQSYLDLQNTIASHTNKELFEKQYYKWTGSTSLGSYLTSSTSSHYDWALKLIKKAVK